jgi:hypothetical protein
VDQKVAEKHLASVPFDIDLAKNYGMTAVPQLPFVGMVAKRSRLRVGMSCG